VAEISRANETIRRLALREYAPMAGWLAAWAIVGLAIGHADAVRLLAASALVRSARYLTSPESAPALRLRLGPTGNIPRRAQATALTMEMLGIVGSLIVVAALVALLLAAGEQETARFCLILAAVLPVRLLIPLFAGKRISAFYQPLLAWTGVLLAVLVWLFDGQALWFAAAFAAREWVAMCLAGLLATRREPASEAADRLHWREIADHSHATSRRRFTYRISKSLLKFVFGPFGSIAARTGRGFKLDRKLERFVPRRTGSLAALFLLFCSLGAGLILALPKPAIQLVAATLLRVGASAGNILIWSKLGRGGAIAGDDDEDEE